MIEVDHLTKYYGPSPAVQDVSFTVGKGEILGFLGPNGAGKSTTMRIITGYLPATSGTVYVDGYDVGEKSLEVRRHVGYLPETVPLYTDISPFDYLDFMGKLKGLRNGAARRERIQEVMEQVHIDNVAHKLIGRLSKGYRQRVGLAQALLANPDVLILDEPTVGLDPRQIIEIRELIKSLGQDHTIILSTHILPEVSMTCTRVVIINRGRLVAVDTPVHLAQDVGGNERVLISVRGPRDNVHAALVAVPGVESVTLQPLEGDSDAIPTFEVVSTPQSDLRPRLAQAIVSQNWDLLELRSLSLSLEDVFLRVTSTEHMEEPLEADTYMEGESEAYVEQELEYQDVADEAAAQADAERVEEVDEIPEPPPPAPRKGGRR